MGIGTGSATGSVTSSGSRPVATRPDLPPTGRARLLPYAAWQLRDYFTNKGLGTVLVVALLLLSAYLPFRAARGSGSETAIEMMLTIALTQVITSFVLFGILFATNGIVSEDRKFGYYRFYFAKPVGVLAFYAQKFVVHMIGFLLVGAALIVAFGFLLRPVHPPAYFPVLALLFVGLGGIGFMLSAMTTADWVSLIGYYLVSLIAWNLYGTDAGWRGWLVHTLPPVHRLNEIYTAVVAQEPVPMKWLMWIFLYGLVCGVIGLVVLSRRRLATT